MDNGFHAARRQWVPRPTEPDSLSRNHDHRKRLAESARTSHAKEVWNDGNVDAIDDLLAEGFVQHSPWEPSELHGREEFKRQIEDFHAAFPDLHGTVDDVIAEGDTVANRFTMRATHRGEFMGVEPTGNEVELAGTIFARVEDGKIAERWVVDDVLGFLEQLGKVEER